MDNYILLIGRMVRLRPEDLEALIAHKLQTGRIIFIHQNEEQPGVLNLALQNNLIPVKRALGSSNYLVFISAFSELLIYLFYSIFMRR